MNTLERTEFTQDRMSTQSDGSAPDKAWRRLNDGWWEHVLSSLAFHLKSWSNRLDYMLLDRQMRKAGVDNVSSIKTWTTHRELKALYDLAATCPTGATVLEIGSYLGASSCYLAAGLRSNGGRLVCVDTWNNETIPEGLRDTFAEFLGNVSGVREIISPVRKRSDELTPNDLPSTLDLVFIDGDHSYHAVNSDYHLLKDHIVEGGILAFHDAIHYEGVVRTIGEALGSGEWRFAGNIDNLIWLTRLGKQG